MRRQIKLLLKRAASWLGWLIIQPLVVVLAFWPYLLPWALALAVYLYLASLSSVHKYAPIIPQ